MKSRTTCHMFYYGLKFPAALLTDSLRQWEGFNIEKTFPCFLKYSMFLIKMVHWKQSSQNNILVVNITPASIAASGLHYFYVRNK